MLLRHGDEPDPNIFSPEKGEPLERGGLLRSWGSHQGDFAPLARHLGQMLLPHVVPGLSATRSEWDASVEGPMQHRPVQVLKELEPQAELACRWPQAAPLLSQGYQAGS